MSKNNGTYFISSMIGFVGVFALVGLIYLLTGAQFKSASSAGSAEDVAERIKPVGAVTLAGDEPVVAATEAEPAAASDPMGLATSSGCMGCHQLDMKVVGPAYRDVAAKYKDDAAALEMLISKVKGGGVGTWGEVPMPPNSQVSDENIRTIVEWVLNL